MFHFDQCIMKKLNTLGLKTEFSQNFKTKFQKISDFQVSEKKIPFLSEKNMSIKNHI